MVLEIMRLIQFLVVLSMTMMMTVRCLLCKTVKQLQLRHCPAVLSISIVDRALQPLSGCLDVQQDTSSKTADMTGGHHAVICTDDQLKV